MPYVLLILYLVNGGRAPATAEFGDQAACETAKAWVLSQAKVDKEWFITGTTQVVVTCTPRGSAG